MDDPRPASVSNMPEYTVSEISGAVKRTLEANFGRVRVRGEMTEVKRYPSGHIYLSLKDENAKISGIVWKTAVPRLGMVPENGVEVIATGRISAYGERSSYQLIVERMEYAGVGALLARIEMIRLRLAAEGLFDAGRKRSLPVLPQVIGVVTSERGAVIQDIRTTIARRFPRTILVWPVPVQGEGAAERIAAAIAGFDAMPPGGDAAPARRADRRARRRQPGRPDGVQRGDRRPRRRRLPHPADLRGRARDRHHADRLRLRPPRADAHRGGRDGDPGARRSGRRPGAKRRAADRRAEPAGAGKPAAPVACRARHARSARRCWAPRGSGWTIGPSGRCWRCPPWWPAGARC